jgi:hypothetical protein
MASGSIHFMFGIKNLASAGVCRSGASQVFFILVRKYKLTFIYFLTSISATKATTQDVSSVEHRHDSNKDVRG